MRSTDQQRGNVNPPPSAARGLSVNEKIDVCRGLFAYLVVLAHGLEVSWGVHPESMERLPSGLRSLLIAVPGTGLYWVMGFFVISGYCIHLSVARLQREERFPLGVYLTARVTRIFPLYYAALVFAVIVEWLIAPARPIAWENGLNFWVIVGQVLAVQNLTQTFGSFAPSWSITNEVLYYLFYGWLAYALVKSRDRLAPVGLGACTALAVGFSVLVFGGVRSPYISSAGMLFGLGVSWFLGAFLAHGAEGWVQARWFRRCARTWPVVLALGIYWKYDERLPPQGIYAFCGLAFVLLLGRFLQAPRSSVAATRTPFAAGMLRMVGYSSYPTYLFHGSVMMVAGSMILRWRLIGDWRLTWALLTGVGILSGIALGYLVEKPLLAWRAGLLQRGKSTRRPSRQESAAGALGATG